jgi:glycosyltransferase involved in cell wall biosynthesis
MHNIDYDIRYNRNIIIKIITYISEKILYKCVKNVSMVTENDCNRVFKLYKIKPILIPNKIDLSNILVVNNISESRYVTFLGSYEYEPNKIAIDFIIDKILPICKLYQLRVIHCGGGKKPFTNSDSFISLGSIADLELYKLLSNSLCNLVPIKYGGGSKVKLLESILAGVPTLAYQESIKGLDFLLPGNPIISNNFFIHDFEKIIKNNFIFKEKAVELAREYRNIYEKYNTIDFK